MFVELDACSQYSDINLLRAFVPNDRYEDFVNDVRDVFLRYAKYGVDERKRTKRTVCKSNILNALRYSRSWHGIEGDVNDDWVASVWGDGTFELYSWIQDVSLTVSLPPDGTVTQRLEKASELLLEEYERYMSNEEE